MAAIETCAFFKLGPRPLDDDSLEDVLDEEVKSAYQALSKEVKELVSLPVFSMLPGMPKAFLQQVTTVNSNLRELTRKDTEDCSSDLRKIALYWLKHIPAVASSEAIDGYMGACVHQQQHHLLSMKRLDQWNYVPPNGRLEKSCESLSPSSPFSATTVQQNLAGENVHFMMFDEGSTKIKCYRFQFETFKRSERALWSTPLYSNVGFCSRLIWLPLSQLFPTVRCFFKMTEWHCIAVSSSSYIFNVV